MIATRRIASMLIFNLGLALAATPVRAQNARAQSHRGFVTGADEDRTQAPTMLFGASRNTVKVSADDTEGRLSMFEYEGAVRGGPPLHVHDDQDEIFYVREGDYLFQLGDALHRLTAGDTIFLPRGVPHAFSQLSAAGRLVFMFTRAGDMEAFFRDQAAMGAGPPTPQAAQDLFSQHGMRIVGPPLPVE
ncbi:cupin domain-containing protein [Brevundimonas diminuta]|uniref:cupin domain-containing protein n=1 Tax=Brevundimonas diminuta TaxID=293 RepID=UPI001F56E92F|nr:cupin domain-containing protein [Brevundimonas diminuta]